MDFEQQAGKPNLLYLVTWKDKVRSVTPTEFHVGPSIYQDYHTYQMTWTKTSVIYTIDGVMVASVYTNVPQDAAYVFLNHWGGNDPNWGGTATIGVDRWMWVQSFSYEAK